MSFTHGLILDSDALATFLAVHREGGVSAAARRLGRTQSAISRRLGQLEGMAGVPLFERIGRGLVLSQAGAALLPHAERAMAAIQDAAAAIETAKSGAAGRVALAVVGTLASTPLTKLLTEFRVALPGVELRLQTATSAEVSQLVRRGDAAIGLRYFEDAANDLQCEIIGHERLLVACAPDHRLAGKRVTSLDALASDHWLAFPDRPRRGEAFAATIFAQFLVRGIAEIGWTAIDSLTAQKRLVEAGFGLALMQESAIAEEVARGDLALIRVGDLAASVPIAAVARKNGFLNQASRALLEQLRGKGFKPSRRHDPRQPRSPRRR
jgi:DNA-binding transcriptional LysR family regulator